MSYPQSRETNLKIKIWRKYHSEVWSRFSHIRGFTRPLLLLRKLADDTEKVSEKAGEPIRNKDWDNLAIIDAARHDIYRETINPDSDSRITLESTSREFIRENFSEGDWSDTVVITANPFYKEEFFKKQTGNKPSDLFHTIFQVWSTDWNEKQGTVMPEKLVEKAETAEKLFPDKKKIIHFMQPHYPFINSDINDRGYGDAFKGENYENIWQELMKGKRDHQKVIQAYKENFKAVKPRLDDLAGKLNGETYVTADHGNLLGECGMYGHPRGSNSKPLRKVPWDKLPINENQ
jgi:hypothetical protein